MNLPFPALPDLPDTQVAEGERAYRYEDITQDGRLRVEGMWAPKGHVMWNHMAIGAPLGRLAMRGIRGVLTDVVMEGGNDRVGYSRRGARHRVSYRLAHTVDEHGAVNRILLESWLESRALAGGPLGEPPLVEGASVLAARAYGRQVFTRPGAPAGQHRVTELDDPELPAVPPERVEWQPPNLLALPDGAVPLDEAPRADSTLLAFGLVHTDGNQHVNFLTYPRLVEDAALRRLAELGDSGLRLARRVDLSYRKPCFAGDRMRLVLQAFRLADDVGVVAVLVADGEAAREGREWGAVGRPHSVLRMTLSR